MEINDEIHSLALTEFNSFPNISFVQGVHQIRHKLNLRKLSDSTIEDAFQRFQTAQLLPNKDQTLTERFLLDVFVAYLDLKHMSDLTHTPIGISKFWVSESMAQSKQIAIYSLENGQPILVVDHFRGEIREFPIQNIPIDVSFGNSVRTKIINNEYVLQIFESSDYQHTYLCLLKLDIPNKNIQFLDHAQFNTMCRHFCSDELNSTRFLLEDFTVGFHLGRVDGGKIVFEQPIRTFCKSIFNKLIGKMIYGFCFYYNAGTKKAEFRYCQHNLLTDKSLLSESRLPFEYQWDDNETSVKGPPKPSECAYHWSRDRFFFVDHNDKLFCVHMFDEGKQMWESINVHGCGMVKDLYFDGNFLIIGCVRTKSIIQTFRFPLRKPDTLNNLVWFKIKRLSILFDSKIYDDVKDTYKATQFLIDFNLN